MKEIPLTKGYVAIVDDDDFEELSKWRWTADIRSGGLVYAKRCIRNSQTSSGKSNIYMHRQIMGVTDKNVLVDHENGDTLFNVRKNLRSCTIGQNTMNARRGKNNTHGFKGVMLRPSGRWGAYVMFNYKSICAGTYDTKDEAALAYDEKAKELHGEFANLNFK